MSELISRDSLLEKLRRELSDASLRQTQAMKEKDSIMVLVAMIMYQAYYKTIDMVVKEPKVEIKFEEKHRGEWVAFSPTLTPGVYYCSKCRNIIFVGDGKPRENFCANCGADMRDENDG